VEIFRADTPYSHLWIHYPQPKSQNPEILVFQWKKDIPPVDVFRSNLQ
jgi:hypothetical protein